MPETAESPRDEASSPETTSRRVAALAVHAFTGSGAVLGAIALISINRGDYASAILIMLFTQFIDAVDGSIARAVGVARVLPSLNGRRLDDIVDFLNFVIVPAVFMVETGLLSAWGWMVFPILASCYGFIQEDAKTEDDFFLGWPSYWNILAVYLYLLEISPTAGAIWATGLAAAIFVPLKYIYPSKLASLPLRYGVSFGGMAWSLLVAFVVVQPEVASRFGLAEISLAYPILYVVLSAWLGDWSRSIPRMLTGRAPSAR